MIYEMSLKESRKIADCLSPLLLPPELIGLALLRVAGIVDPSAMVWFGVMGFAVYYYL